MSIKINKDIDSEIFNDAFKEIESIKNASVLKRTANAENNTEEDNPEIDPKYSEPRNFYYPYLYKLLEREFPNYKFKLDKRQIEADNFPKKGMFLKIDGRVDLYYNKQHKNYILNQKKQQIINEVSVEQIYFNSGVVNIYTDEGWEFRKEDIKNTAQSFLKIIKKLRAVL